MNPSSADEDFSPLKEQLAQMKREGRHDEVLRLQADIKKQVSNFFVFFVVRYRVFKIFVYLLDR